ncbi:MAG TPA: Holliday junction resolvase RuvX [Patescibacteria group bacterium]|nr:Holliday junction resolvase RuvX [Patescibacteria group bacterium]
MRLLGIDYGKKKLGIALGETEGKIAMPVKILPNLGEETIRLLVKQVTTEDIGAVIVGVPLAVGSWHGSGQLTQTRKFIERLGKALSVPIYEEDESYTTSESLRLQREEGALAEEDALAAMLILEQFMNRRTSDSAPQ